MTLRPRLTLTFTLLGLVLVVTVAGSSWLLSTREITRSIDRSLEERAVTGASLTQLELDAELRRAVQANDVYLTTSQSGGAIVTDLGGIASDSAMPTLITAAALPRTGEILDGDSWFMTVQDDDVAYRVHGFSMSPRSIGPNGELTAVGLVLFEDVTAQRDAAAALAQRLIALGTAAISAVAITAWFVGRRLARPIATLTEAVESVTDQSAPVHRIEIERSDEVGRLADRFNRLMAALEIGREQQQRLVADASHELRTPLTAIRMRAEYLASFDDLSTEQQTVIDGAVLDVEQLTALVDELIDLAATAQSPEEEAVQVRLADIAELVVARTMTATGRRIELEADDSAPVGYPSVLRRAMQNLVDNAIKYSADGRPVTMRIVDHRVTVIDQGEGIPEEDLRHVFDRFFRSPKARNRPGNGIGLAIVKQAAEQHGGRPFAANHPDGGAAVGFTAPGLDAIAPANSLRDRSIFS